jgi:hypothetical protein
VENERMPELIPRRISRLMMPRLTNGPKDMFHANFGESGFPA